MIPAAPTTELGRSTLGFTLPGWDKFATAVDEREYAPQLTWPTSVLTTFPHMETDAQISGLLLGTMLPIRRFRWSIDPAGARDEVVDHIARDFNLPIKGEDAPPLVKRSEVRNRFSHDRHLAHALRALPLGHYPFEQVGAIGPDGKWHLRKLAPRPPYTIADGGEIKVDRDGGLAGIKQGLGLEAGLIPVNRLVYYCWDQEGANWFGRSLIRSCFRHWARKDRLLRVDAMKHERNSMGVPWFETAPELSQTQVDQLAATARRYRSGDNAGGAGPGKLQIKGVDGSLPDIIESIRYDDQQMSMALLMLFVDLGRNSETGSRSLGDSFIDWYGYAQEAIADWYAGVTTEHAIWDDVDWNYGLDENAPALIYDRSETEDLPTSDLALLIDKGVVTVDSTLEAQVREKHNLPDREESDEPIPAGQSYAYDLDNGIVTIDERRAQIGLPPREDGLGALTVPEFIAAHGGDGENAVTGDPVVPPSISAKRQRHARAAATEPTNPRRELFEHEVRAAVDFESIETVQTDERDDLVADVGYLQEGQVEDLRSQIEDAGGDLDALLAVAATPVAATKIVEAMKRTARTGIEQTTAEAKAQGLSAPKAVDLDELDEALTARAAAKDATLGRSLTEAAVRKALDLSGGSLAPEQVATAVAEHLTGLSTAYLQEQLGGTVTEALNTGRKAVMRVNPPSKVFASELLDETTCENCEAVDGTEYATLDEAEQDYPTGGKADCLGGLRCRGTVVAEWS